MINKKLLTMTISCIVATGCTSMNGDYDCPIKTRPSCISLRDMDRSLKDSSYRITSSAIHKEQLPLSFPRRTKDLITKIWLAPYEDSEGNYHQASYMYTVV